MRSHLWPFTDVLREIWLAVTQKVRKTADYTDVTDKGGVSWLASAAAGALQFGPQIRHASFNVAQDGLEARSTTPSESHLYLCYPRNP